CQRGRVAIQSERSDQNVEIERARFVRERRPCATACVRWREETLLQVSHIVRQLLYGLSYTLRRVGIVLQRILQRRQLSFEVCQLSSGCSRRFQQIEKPGHRLSKLDAIAFRNLNTRIFIDAHGAGCFFLTDCEFNVVVTRRYARPGLWTAKKPTTTSGRGSGRGRRFRSGRAQIPN